MLTKYTAHLEEIDRLESRIEALENILRDAGIEIPDNFTGSVVQNINSARGIDDDVDNDLVFQEVLNILHSEA